MQTAPKASPNRAWSLLAMKGWRWLQREYRCGRGALAAWVSPCVPLGVFFCFCFFLGEPPAERQRLEPKALCLWRSWALSRREEAASLLGPSLAEPAPGTEGACSGSRAGLQPPALLSTRSKASLKLFGHFGMWYFKWLF